MMLCVEELRELFAVCEERKQRGRFVADGMPGPQGFGPGEPLVLSALSVEVEMQQQLYAAVVGVVRPLPQPLMQEDWRYVLCWLEIAESAGLLPRDQLRQLEGVLRELAVAFRKRLFFVPSRERLAQLPEVWVTAAEGAAAVTALTGVLVDRKVVSYWGRQGLVGKKISRAGNLYRLAELVKLASGGENGGNL